MEKNYVIKSVVAKAGSDWKVLGYNINYHHRNYPESVQSQFYSVEDMKNFFGINNEQQASSLVGQSCWIKKELIIK